MAIMESISFSYDGKYSSDYGIYNVSLDSGLYKEKFLAPRKILETTVRGNPKPYFHGVEYEPLTLSLTFAFNGTWDDRKIRDVARWLGNQEYYKPLWFSEDPSRIFYAMAVEDSELIHTGLKQGYITLTMRCDSPYSYSPVFASNQYDFSVNGGTFTFANEGDAICRPEIWITKVGFGDVTIKNLTNHGKEFKFTGLSANEVVYIDNEREYIETDVANAYRYSNFNNEYLEMVRGVNTLEVTGNCKIQLRYQFKRLQ